MSDYEKYNELFNMLNIDFESCDDIIPCGKSIIVLVDGVYVGQFIFDVTGKLLELNIL